MKKYFLVAWLVSCMTLSAHAQSPYIDDFQYDGSLLCTNILPQTTCTVERTSSLEDSWLSFMTVTNASSSNAYVTVQIDEPSPQSFYRVRGIPEVLQIPGGALTEPQREAVDYVEGGGFESASDWVIDSTTAPPAVVTMVTTNESHSGTHSLWINIQDSSTVTVKQRLYFVKGFTYDFSVWYNGGFQSLDAWVTYYDVQEIPSPSLSIHTNTSMTSPGTWTELAIEQDIRKNAYYFQVEIVIQGPANVYLDDVAVSAEVYTTKTVPTTPVEPLYIAWIIHIEDPSALTNDSSFFNAKATVFEELAKVFHTNDASFIIQPEIEILLGSEIWDPHFVSRLTSNYHVEWSTHTHGPYGDSNTMDDVIDYTQVRKDKLEALGSGPITDHNGNFDMPDIDELATIGFSTLSAYKFSETQFPPEGYYLNPWRPSDVSPHTNETGWAVHDRSGGLIFIPGTGASVLRYKSQLNDLMERYLTTALANVQEGQVNVYTFVDHVDHFFSTNGLPINVYVGSPEFQRDLDYYSLMLTNLVQPWVDSGHVIWATIPEIQTVFEGWETTNCPVR